MEERDQEDVVTVHVFYNYYLQPSSLMSRADNMDWEPLVATMRALALALISLPPPRYMYPGFQFFILNMCRYGGGWGYGCSWVGGKEEVTGENRRGGREESMHSFNCVWSSKSCLGDGGRCRALGIKRIGNFDWISSRI
jgi:hypothetical protein